MWAIKVDAIGKPPASYERVSAGAQLPGGYDFITSSHPVGKIVDTDGQSLRDKTQGEILNDARYKKWLEIKAYRDAIKKGGVLVATKWFHTDDASRIQHLGLVQLGANIPAGIMWKTLDDTFIEMTQQIASDIFSAVTQLDIDAFANAETHRANMEASQDPANYDYSTGWPTTYLYG